jgi:hypothetical protein
MIHLFAAIRMLNYRVRQFEPVSIVTFYPGSKVTTIFFGNSVAIILLQWYTVHRPQPKKEDLPWRRKRSA